jgi:hypothetical protein
MHRQFIARSSALDSRHFLVDPPDDLEQLTQLIVDGIAAGQFTFRVP